ncbi:hypothetical protein [Sphingomonas sanguinis]|uniref:hypothetical protein n=1 Tax=Sphingomonas sanguinis TaxID=33051 RepID=UPI00077BFE14|nr:hypothetical protein [Sphingomonas sanguinis]
MSIATTFTLRCDRCGVQAIVVDGNARPDGWGGIAARRHGGGASVGKDGLDDLCPTCIDDLLTVWFAQVPATAAPIATPAPRPRPVFTIEDRKRAIDSATGALLTSLEALRQNLRDDPTSILTDQLPAALTEPLAFHAHAIVTAIVRRLNLEDPA